MLIIATELHHTAINQTFVRFNRRSPVYLALCTQTLISGGSFKGWRQKCLYMQLNRYRTRGTEHVMQSCDNQSRVNKLAKMACGGSGTPVNDCCWFCHNLAHSTEQPVHIGNSDLDCLKQLLLSRSSSKACPTQDTWLRLARMALILYTL